ncbi:MAG: ATP-binding protein [Balneolaceae bacterium]|nr:ATP-binding protein [Balneolaceae bacterium]
MLALSEAVTNAIVHGNGEDPEKSVTVRSTLDEGRLSISVQDEGRASIPNDLPDPLREEICSRRAGAAST